jgi:hypothetical protein
MASYEHESKVTRTAEDQALTASLKLLLEIQAAIQSSDPKTIRHAAGALKASITSVLAKEAFDLAALLEKILQDGDLACAEDACRRLRAALKSLHPVPANSNGSDSIKVAHGAE